MNSLAHYGIGVCDHPDCMGEWCAMESCCCKCHRQAFQKARIISRRSNRIDVRTVTQVLSILAGFAIFYGILAATAWIALRAVGVWCEIREMR